MRIASLIAFAGLVTVQLALCTVHRDDTPCECEQSQTSADLCLDDAVERDGPVSVDDDALQKHLEQQGGAIIEQGKATDIQALVKQLGLDRCELDLTIASAPFESDSQLFSHAKDSVVVVSSIFKCDKCNDWHATTATGFVISSSGAIATNYHVMDNPDKETVVVMTADGQVFPVKRVLAASRADDLAIIQVDAQGLVPLPIAAEAEPVGSHIGVISHPSQRFYCYTDGIVSRYMRMKPKDQVVDGMTITADYARGSSGAPVLNSKGQVVGIVQSTNSIYYSEEKGRQKNLQMVFKQCIPATSLLKLIARQELAAEG
jgi:serine protease Do